MNIFPIYIRECVVCVCVCMYKYIYIHVALESCLSVYAHFVSITKTKEKF